MAQKRKFKGKFKICAAVILAAVCIVISVLERNLPSNFDSSVDFVKVLDVGQSESILIYSNGYSALIDTGISDYAADICVALEECDIKELDVMMISHLHSDHTGGIERILENYSVNNLILPELSIESEGMAQAQLAINSVTSSGGEVYSAVQGMNFKVGEFEITVLAAYGDMADENNRSIIAVAEIDGIKFMFTGDAETKVEKKLLEEGLNLKCDVLKMGHHGSSTSSSEEFLKAVRPRYAAISAGAGNMYGHPHNEVLASLEHFGTKIYRTDYDGDITFFIRDGKINPETEK